MCDLDTLKRDLNNQKNPEKSKILAGFFKTGKGQYGEGDKFLGITVPVQRKIAKKHIMLPLTALGRLLDTDIHEFRLTALLVLVEQYQRSDARNKKKIIDFYLSKLSRVNNWDLVDLTAPKILGDYLLDKKRSILYNLAVSEDLWERRVSIISTFSLIRAGEYEDTLKISAILLNDSHDLVHKAVGWMLREVGNRDRPVEEKFLKKYYKKMPRTMLRYAIEKFGEYVRQKYLHGEY